MKNLNRFRRVADAHVTMTRWILEATDGPREEMHQSLTFGLGFGQISQRPISWFERLSH